MEVLYQILSKLDQKVIIAIIVVLAILLVISLIKKAIKLAVFLIILILINSFVLPVVKNYQEKYNFRFEDGKAYITVDGDEIELSRNNIQSLDFKDTDENGDMHIAIRANDKDYDVVLPGFMKGKVQDMIAEIVGELEPEPAG